MKWWNVDACRPTSYAIQEITKRRWFVRTIVSHFYKTKTSRYKIVFLSIELFFFCTSHIHVIWHPDPLLYCRHLYWLAFWCADHSLHERHQQNIFSQVHLCITVWKVEVVECTTGRNLMLRSLSWGGFHFAEDSLNFCICCMVGGTARVQYGRIEVYPSDWF